jgi:hypothetical protein
MMVEIYYFLWTFIVFSKKQNKFSIKTSDVSTWLTFPLLTCFIGFSGNYRVFFGGNRKLRKAFPLIFHTQVSGKMKKISFIKSLHETSVNDFWETFRFSLFSDCFRVKSQNWREKFISLERNAEEESRGKLCEVFFNRIEENRNLNFTLDLHKINFWIYFFYKKSRKFSSKIDQKW